MSNLNTSNSSLQEVNVLAHSFQTNSPANKRSEEQTFLFLGSSWPQENITVKKH